MKLSPCLPVLAAVLAACTPSAPTPTRPQAAVPKPAAPGPVVTKAAPASTVPAAKGPAAPVAAARPFDESLVRGREFLLEVRDRTAPGARDSLIGPVSADAGLRAVVQAFVDAVPKGPAEATLVPRWADYLRSWARSHQDLSGQVRIGTPLGDETSSVTLPVRIWNDSKTWTGWVVLEKKDAAWLIGDVQINPAAFPGAQDPEVPVSSLLVP